MAQAAAWPERTWAVEGAGGLGHLLAQQLVAAGERVLDVQPKLGARVRLLAAKVSSYALAGAVLSLVVTVVIMLVGTLILSSRGETTVGAGDLADVLWRNLVVAAAFGALGVCVGGLLRNPIVAIIVLLSLAFVVEPAVLGLAPNVGRFGPTVGAPSADRKHQRHSGIRSSVSVAYRSAAGVGSVISSTRRHGPSASTRSARMLSPPTSDGASDRISNRRRVSRRNRP